MIVSASALTSIPRRASSSKADRCGAPVEVPVTCVEGRDKLDSRVRYTQLKITASSQIGSVGQASRTTLFA